MEKAVRELFSNSILEKAAHAYSIDRSAIELLNGFESFIFRVHRKGQGLILRIGHASRRTADLVQGEAEFLNHLYQGGLSVPRVIPSDHGCLVEQIPARDGTIFLATLFTHAPGHPPLPNQWGADLFSNMGAFMGQLHQLSKGFHPSEPHFTRYDIEHDFAEMMAIGQKSLPPGDQPILDAYQDVIDTILHLPKDPAGYGLCHVDFHRGNFFLTDDGKITLFDFDDCQYAWFIYDIAMALFYAISPDCTTPENLAEARRLLSHFWQGYQKENDLDGEWLKSIPLFLRLREIDLYFVIHRSMDMDNLDSWCSRYMEGRREKIINKMPYCGMDYGSLAD